MKLGNHSSRRDNSGAPANREDIYDPFATFAARSTTCLMISGRCRWHARSGQRLRGGSHRRSTSRIRKARCYGRTAGLDEKDFEVTLAGDILTIKGEKKNEHENRSGGEYQLERRFVLRLPFETTDEQIEARYDKGVLTIHLPKPPEAQRQVRRIEVNAAEKERTSGIS